MLWMKIHLHPVVRKSVENVSFASFMFVKESHFLTLTTSLVTEIDCIWTGRRLNLCIAGMRNTRRSESSGPWKQYAKGSNFRKIGMGEWRVETPTVIYLFIPLHLRCAVQTLGTGFIATLLTAFIYKDSDSTPYWHSCIYLSFLLSLFLLSYHIHFPLTYFNICERQRKSN